MILTNRRVSKQTAVMHQQVGVKKIHQLLNELPVDKDELNRRSKFGKADLCNFYGKVGFYGQPQP